MNQRVYAWVAAAVVAATAACGAPDSPQAHREAAGAEEARFDYGELLQPFEPAIPAFQASLPPELHPSSAELAGRALRVEGVTAAARVSLGHVTTRSEQGSADISIAAVDPVEFRPLAPRVTSEAEFVWRGLLAGQVFLAHEEHRRLGVQPGSVIYLGTAGGGMLARRVGGVAANGVPNLAGVLISSKIAPALGLPEPHFLLIGIGQGEAANKVASSLKRELRDVTFQPTPAAQRAFFTGSESERLFGTLSFVVNPDGSITPDEEWVRRNIVTKKVPILGSVRCHRVMLRQLVSALAEIESRGLAGSIDVADYHRQGGCYVPRLIRGENPNRPLSMHAWGLAIDINVGENPPGAPSKQNPEMVAIFERWGFRWGGRWSPADAHHFELAALVRD